MLHIILVCSSVGAKTSFLQYTNLKKKQFVKNKRLFEITWDIEEYRVLQKQCHSATNKLKDCIQHLQQSPNCPIDEQQQPFNLPRHLHELQSSLPLLIRSIERKKRTVATRALLPNQVMLTICTFLKSMGGKHCYSSVTKDDLGNLTPFQSTMSPIIP